MRLCLLTAAADDQVIRDAVVDIFWKMQPVTERTSAITQYHKRHGVATDGLGILDVPQDAHSERPLGAR